MENFIFIYIDPLNCDRSVGLLYLILACATFWISINLYGFQSTPYITKRKRELIADYSLFIGVISVTIIANLFFNDIPSKLLYL